PPCQQVLRKCRDWSIGEKGLKIARQKFWRLVATLGCRLQRLQTDCLQLPGYAFLALARWWKIPLQARLAHFAERGGGQGRHAANQLVEHRSQAVDVAGGPDLHCSVQLFWARILWSETSGRTRLARTAPNLDRLLAGQAMPMFTTAAFRQSPVDDESLAVTPQHDVVRLQIAVNHSPRVGISQDRKSTRLNSS